MALFRTTIHALAFSLMLISDCHSALDPIPQLTFDFYYFVRQWPAGLCSSADCGKHYPRDFTVRGLWPAQETYCDTSASFNLTEVEELRPELDQIWPSLVGPRAATDLWNVAWEMYGTCCFKSQHAYFSRIIELHQQYPLLNPLSSWQVVPSDFETYSRWEIEEPVEQWFGARPVVQCKGKKLKYITEIWMCFDLEFQPMECPRETSDDCQLLRFPATPRIQRGVPVWKIVVGSLTLLLFGFMMIVNRRPCWGTSTRRETTTEDHEQPLMVTEET